MQKFIDHARSFRTRSFRDVLARRDDGPRGLAAGQSPSALFISCSDSRVIPSLITGAEPGELFELRTAGGIVPDHSLGRPSGETATIEFAVEILNVADVVVCGHSHCGAVGALVRGEDLSGVPAVRGWLTDAVPPGEADELARTLPASGAADPGPDLAAAVQRHVLTQVRRLRRYPAIERRLVGGGIGLHGWYYEVDTGSVFSHHPDADVFLPL